jgi:hypothetical protein
MNEVRIPYIVLVLRIFYVISYTYRADYSIFSLHELHSLLSLTPRLFHRYPQCPGE